ncbi:MULTISPECIES: glycosyltransferase [Streptococcus]|jgi:ceramide glucosyltransferase, putative|uniref:glycosyltransferase n=1 Tax=Streptococcus TaxID=1301 RepID=UPI0009B79A56|nr:MULTISPECIES: glycosyltransferase [Streptococcus]ARC22692.1 ceramide glucosyltransferase [Streptococcus sp. FDAARGOS_192]MTQ48266.1 glycosyltransferase [Streptococcus salivarius]
MKLIFIIIAVAYLLLFLVRWLLSLIYYKKGKSDVTDFPENLFTVVQPILSGDPRLESDLRANLQQTKTVEFYWLIDQSDTEAQRVANKICQDELFSQRIRIFLIEDVPQGINPKSYKIEQVVEDLTRPYLIVLDDDSVIDFSKMGELTAYLGQEVILTGIPYNQERSNFWSKLVAAFVNGNSLITYFTMAQVEANHSINGMFYILPVNLVKDQDLFTAIKDYLCDDLAVADFLSSKGVSIVQTRVTCNVRTTIKSATQYLLQMKRWLLFSSIYLKKHLDFKVFTLIGLTSFLPLPIILLTLFLGWPYLLVALVLLLIKAIWMLLYRQSILMNQLHLDEVLYEVLNDFLLPWLFLYVLLTPPVINWRGRKIRVTDGKIRYE